VSDPVQAPDSTAGLTLRFLGGAAQVTGSCTWVQVGSLRLLVDCGMYQERDSISRNWDPFPFCPKQIDGVLLTHAHLDHTGLLPRLVRAGFSGPIWATPATADLAGLVLRDAGHLQEEDAAFKRRRHQREGRQAAYPEVPLSTADDAELALGQFRPWAYDQPLDLGSGVTATFRDAGHILGSARLDIAATDSAGATRRLVFSGDVGQWQRPLVRDPVALSDTDWLVCESTYGDRDHEDDGDIAERLAAVVNHAVHAGGNLLIPTFAIERAQELMYYLSRLVWEDRIPHLLVFLDSPLAVNATEVFLRHPECLDDDARDFLARHRSPFAFPGLRLVHTVEESKAINRIRGTCIIMAGAGMCTGGRIKHHLEHQISRPETTVLFVGYQARGTLGRQLLEGCDRVRIHGQQHAVRARIEQIHGFSAHAGRSEIRRWLAGLPRPPRQVFFNHGDAEVCQTLADSVRQEFGWETAVPQPGQQFELR
jgi:metallo-beta-lactamase family protein